MENRGKLQENAVPILLGVAKEALTRHLSIDVRGLTDTILLQFFPQKLNRLVLVLFFPSNIVEHSASIVLDALPAAGSGTAATVSLTLRSESNGQGADVITPEQLLTVDSVSPVPPGASGNFGRRRSLASAGHVVVIPFPDVWIFRPCEVRIRCTLGDQAFDLGGIEFYFAAPFPLTPDELVRLESTPNGARGLTLHMTCAKCSGRFSARADFAPTHRFSTALEGVPKLADLGTDWKCPCGQVHLDLELTRLGLPAMARCSEFLAKGTLFDIPLLFVDEPRPLDVLVRRYDELIRSSPEEEQVQAFLEQHHQLWGFVAPRRVLSKPNILTKHRADFGIVSASGRLYFVEIEKPSTPLVTQTGGIASKLQAGLSQINDWRMVVQNDRRTLLNQLGLDRAGSLEIKYILIAGLRSAISDEDLRRIRSAMPHDVEFLTFDELWHRLLPPL
jgi:hypothetical protein